MNNLLLLCFELLKIGLFSIGGGLATLPYFMELSRHYPHWVNQQQLADLIAVSESTPGPMGVNLSTYVGFLSSGILGGVVATLSLVLPSVIVIILLSKVLQKFAENPIVLKALEGLRAGVTGLIAAAGLTVFRLSIIKDTRFQILHFALFILFFICMQLKSFKKVHPVLFILIGAVLGILFKL
ncbi:MAG: chromate transporter [Eubacteriales bacterium]|nr:chromate transporter [Eubacteriales bacterium]